MKSKTKISVIFISIFYLFTISNADTGFGVSDVGTISSIFTSVINVPADQPSIQAGINAATNGDTVLVADSTYFENINFNGKAITVASWFLWDGDSSHIDNTIIDGSLPSNPDSGSVVSFVSGEDTNSVLCGFTITNGTGTVSTYSGSDIRSGGGIFCYNSGASIESNKILNNSVSHNDASGGGIRVVADSIKHVNVLGNFIKDNIVNGVSAGANGGGLLFANASGKIIGNVINKNSCTRSSGEAAGGGVNLWSDSTLTPVPFVIVKDNQISYNLASGVGIYYAINSAVGGGLSITTTNALVYNNNIINNEINGPLNIYTQGAGLCLTGVTDITVVDGNLISQNTGLQGYSWGGGIRLLYCTEPVIINNKIINNNASNGGGIFTWSSDPYIVNNIIINNNATVGAGIFSDNSDPVLINNTIINNIAALFGGGLYLGTTNSVVMNSIIWGNQAPNYPSIRLYLSTLEVVYSDVQGTTVWPGTGNINLDPLFSDTLLFNLSDSSQCIGAGIDSIEIGGIWYYAPPFDYDGDPRPNPVDMYVDIGAQESPYLISGIIKEDSDNLPKTFSLKNNYPNPFNPSTTIEFSIPNSEFVTLKIYNLLGQEMTTLVSDKLTPGEYKYTWDASQLASGMYFYKLETESYSNTKKLILLK